MDLSGFRLTVLISGSLALAACGLGADGPPDRARIDNQGTSPTDGTSTVSQAAVTPMLDPTSSGNPACGTHVAVTGQAQPGVTVIADAPAGQATAQASTQSGRFCLAVPVQPGQPNRIAVSSIHPETGASNPAYVTVTPATSCAQAGRPVTTSAVSSSATSGTGSSGGADTPVRIVQVRTSEENPKEGTEAALTDGDRATHVHYAPFGLPWEARSDEMWIWLSFDRPRLLSKLIIHWREGAGSGYNYAEKYLVAVSSDTNNPGSPPPPPSGTGSPLGATAGQHWTYIRREADEKGGEDLVDLTGSQPVAQHVALWLESDASISAAEHFDIAEIEAYTISSAQTSGGGTTPGTTGTLTGVCAAY